MNCRCLKQEFFNKKLQKWENELIEVSKKVFKSANDPFSAVIKFLHEPPEHTLLPGFLINKILLETFGSSDKIPSLVNLLTKHIKEIMRSSNIISITNEHTALERWNNYLIKQKERIKFEIVREKDKLVLRNIAGLICIEHGVEVPLNKVLVNPPKLELTLQLGLLRLQRVVDIL